MVFGLVTLMITQSIGQDWELDVSKFNSKRTKIINPAVPSKILSEYNEAADSRIIVPIDIGIPSVEGVANEYLDEFKPKFPNQETRKEKYLARPVSPLSVRFDRNRILISGEFYVFYWKRYIGKVDATIRLTMEIEVLTSEDWNVKTNTTISHEFVKKPDYSQILGMYQRYFQIRINMRMMTLLDDLAKSIDEKIQETIDFTHHIEKVWENVQRPIEVKDTFGHYWLHVFPKEFGISKLFFSGRGMSLEAAFNSTFTVYGDSLPPLTVSPFPPKPTLIDKFPSHIKGDEYKPTSHISLTFYLPLAMSSWKEGKFEGETPVIAGDPDSKLKFWITDFNLIQQSEYSYALGIEFYSQLKGFLGCKKRAKGKLYIDCSIENCFQSSLKLSDEWYNDETYNLLDKRADWIINYTKPSEISQAIEIAFSPMKKARYGLLDLMLKSGLDSGPFEISIPPFFDSDVERVFMVDNKLVYQVTFEFITTLSYNSSD